MWTAGYKYRDCLASGRQTCLTNLFTIFQCLLDSSSQQSRLLSASPFYPEQLEVGLPIPDHSSVSSTPAFSVSLIRLKIRFFKIMMFPCHFHVRKWCMKYYYLLCNNGFITCNSKWQLLRWIQSELKTKSNNHNSFPFTDVLK